MAEINTVLDEMRKTHEALKEHVDKQIEEMRKDNHVSALTQEAVEKANAELTELRSKYDELIKANQRPAHSENAGGQDEELRKEAFTKFLRYGAGDSARSMMSAEEIRALSSASDKDGGFLVPTAWESTLLMNAYNESEIRPVANVASTGRDTVYMPALQKPSVAWGVTNVAVTAQDLAAGSERLPINDLRALVLIHNNTLDDADANIWAELNGAFSRAIAEAEDTAFAAGSGVNQPQGVIADSRVQANFKLSGVADKLSDANNNGVDPLIGALYSLKKIYRRNATWALNSATEAEVRKLKDGDKNYLWQPPVQAGAPATLLGRPLINPEGMPDIAAGSFPIVIGDFRTGYAIRDRAGVTVQRLIERYAEYDQTGFLVKRRTGGQVVLPEAFACLKIAAS